VTLDDIRNSIYRRFNYLGTPLPKEITDRITEYINQTHREICAMPGMDKLRDDVMAVTAYSGIARTGLPYVIARIYAITDRTNNLKLDQVPLRQLRIMDPAQAFTGGYPVRFAFIGRQAVYRQPGGSTPAASGLWAASTAAADTTQKVFAETIVTGGMPNATLTAGTTLTGTARVQIGTLTSHLEVTKFYLDVPATGTVSLYDAAAAGNELAAIPINHLNSRYQAVEWSPIQQQNTTEYVDFQRLITDLSDASDEPLLPPDFHELIVLGASLREFKSTDDSRYDQTLQEYERMKIALKNFVMNNGDRVSSLRPMRQPWSRLGGNYPPDCYY
jgi:hypothetical protein